MEHEAPIELCREHPEVVPAILQQLLKVPLPAYTRVRVTDPNTRALVATGQRCDAAVLLEDNDQPVLAAILEPQGGVDPGKWYSWPKYLADLHAEVRCDTYLIVLALTRSVATWAQSPILSFQPNHGLIPLVVGPDELPRVTSVAAARVMRSYTARIAGDAMDILFVCGTDFGTHFRVRIASPFFTGKSRVAQHRLVYDALQEFIDQGVHALAIEIL